MRTSSVARPAPEPILADVPALSKLAYSIKEAAEVSGLSRAFLYNEWKEGRGPSRLKAGKRTLITDESLRSWLRSLEYKAVPAS